MSKKRIVYEKGGAFLELIMDKDPDSVEIICPACNQVMVFAPTWESAKALGTTPGIYCTNSPPDVVCRFNLATSD